MSLDRDLDTLYRAPLENFVARRNELAKELRRAKDVEAAERIAKLPRPTPAAWVVNQLYFRMPERLSAITALRNEALAASRRADAAAVMDLAQRRRRALDELASVAAGILSSAGHGASPAVQRAVRLTLDAVTTDPGALDPSEAPGRLSRDLEPPALVDWLDPAKPPASTPPPVPSRPIPPPVPSRSIPPPVPSRPSSPPFGTIAPANQQTAPSQAQVPRAAAPAEDPRVQQARALVESASARVREIEQRLREHEAQLQSCSRAVSDAEVRASHAAKLRDLAIKAAEDANQECTQLREAAGRASSATEAMRGQLADAKSAVDMAEQLLRLLGK